MLTVDKLVLSSALSDWFTPSGRRNRKSFMLAMIALILTFVALYVIWLLFAQTADGRAAGLLLFGLPAGLCSYFLVAQRLRDFNVSGWFSLLWILINAFGSPVRGALTLAALVVLCGVPGTPGPNKFGDRPLSS